MGLLEKLADLLRPVYPRSKILVIFDPFSTSWYGIPLGTFGYCWLKKTYLNLMRFELPRKMDVRSLQGLTLPCQPEFLVLVVWAVMMWSHFWYFLVWLPERVLEFCWDPPQYLEWAKNPWGQQYLVHHFASCIEHDISNWGYCAFPHERNCGKFIIKNHMNLRWDMNSFWV